MPWAGLIWLIIFIVRSMWNDDASSVAGKAGNILNARGRVAGDRGPDLRSFRGRAGRREWWVTMAWSAFLGAVVSNIVPVVGVLLALPWTISSLAVTSRRLHDLTLSAWLQTIPMAIAAASLTFYGVAHYAAGIAFNQTIVSAGIALIVAPYLILYLFVGFAPSRTGSNCYGEADPA